MAAGRLLLMPNTLDLGAPAQAQPPLADVLPAHVIEQAAAVEHWVVENARSTRAFLKRVAAVAPLRRPLQALNLQELPRPHKGRADARADTTLLAPLLAPALGGADVALQSEAGLPGIADPGADLVWLAHQHGIEVHPLVGPSSLMLALMGSGLHGQSFAFVGYLPVEPPARVERLRALERRATREQQTQIFIETPYRNLALWQSLMTALAPQTRVAVATCLTMPGAAVHCAPVAQWRQQPPPWHETDQGALRGPDTAARPRRAPPGPSVFLIGPGAPLGRPPRRS